MFVGLHQKHKRELEKLTLTSQPFKTLKFFSLAILQHINRSLAYILAHVCLLILLIAIIVAIGVFLVTDDGPHKKVLHILFKMTKSIGLINGFLHLRRLQNSDNYIFFSQPFRRHFLRINGWNPLVLQHVEVLIEYLRFGMWWVALGVASSIGLGKHNY